MVCPVSSHSMRPYAESLSLTTNSSLRLLVASLPMLLATDCSCTENLSAASGTPSEIMGMRRVVWEAPSGMEEVPGVETSSVAIEVLLLLWYTYIGQRVKINIGYIIV